MKFREITMLVRRTLTIFLVAWSLAAGHSALWADQSTAAAELFPELSTAASPEIQSRTETEAATAKTTTDIGPTHFTAQLGSPLKDKLKALSGKNPDIAHPRDPSGKKFEPPKHAGTYRHDENTVDWHAYVVKPEPEDGDVDAVLVLRAAPDSPYHVYAAAVEETPFSTVIAVTEKAGMKVGRPSTEAKVVVDSGALAGTTTKYHEGIVAWRMPIKLSDDAKSGNERLQGAVVYQSCTKSACLPPDAFQFSVPLKVAAHSREIEVRGEVKLVAAKPNDVYDQIDGLKWVDQVGAAKASDQDKTGGVSPAGDDTEYSFAAMLLFAFLGGIILNVMPCVLPVVGLKVMSFVQQAGEDRGRVFLLNVVYALGILAVFGVLAALAVAWGFSWGQQFTYFPFKLTLTLALFALALSYLGVWEIPAPGMASGKVSQDLQSREGYAGAFSKGMFATILATPCSGPLLGAIFGLSIFFSPLQKVVVIMAVGIGMALPYLIIGLNPKLVSWLPKPGGWMETVKEFLAFLLLGTVAFFFAGFQDDYKLPVFVALIGVWFGCWIIGRVPSWEKLQRRLLAWSGGVAAAALIGVLAFRALSPSELIRWEPYNESRLQALQAEGRTVMLDFTASWCVNCKINTNFAIDTEKTKQRIEELDAVPMLADWSDYNEDIKRKLEELQSNSIPLLAIYPGKSPGRPIVLRDLVTQAGVLDALDQAGPSLDESIAADETSALRLATNP